MAANLHHLIFGQSRSLIENFAACLQFADIVQQRRGAHVFDAILGHAHLSRNLRGVERNTVRMVLRKFVVGDEVVQNLQHAIIRFPKFAQPSLSMFVECSRSVCGDQ